jgi:hypothetical protein
VLATRNVQVLAMTPRTTEWLCHRDALFYKFLIASHDSDLHLLEAASVV